MRKITLFSMIIAVLLSNSTVGAQTSQMELISASIGESADSQNIILSIRDNNENQQDFLICEKEISNSSYPERFKVIDFQGDLKQGYALIHYYTPGYIGKNLQFIKYKEGSAITTLAELRYVDWHPYYQNAISDLLHYKINNKQLLLVLRGSGDYLLNAETDYSCSYCWEERITILRFEDKGNALAEIHQEIFYKTDLLFKDYPELFDITTLFKEETYSGYEYMDEYTDAGHIFKTGSYYQVESSIKKDTVTLKFILDDKILTLKEKTFNEN